MNVSDHNINITITKFEQAKQTSATGKVHTRDKRTSTNKSAREGFSGLSLMGNSSLVKGIKTGGALYIAKKTKDAVAKGANFTNRVIGQTSNLRHREKLTSDYLDAVFSPKEFAIGTATFAISNHFNVERMNIEKDYNQRLSGNLLPSVGKNGITL